MMPFAGPRPRFRRILVAVAASTIGLSACIQSEDMLLTEAEITQPFPDTFTLFFYAREDDAYELSLQDDGSPTMWQFTREGAGYLLNDPEQELDSAAYMYVAPIADDTYIAALSGDGGTMFGFASFEKQIMWLDFLADFEGELARLHAKADEANARLLDAMELSEGSVMLPSRDGLFYLAARWQAGDLEISGGPFYWVSGHVDGTDPASAPPLRIAAPGNSSGG